MAFQGLRVLVVDDEQSARKFLHDLLRLCGSEVESAINGEESIEKYRRFWPDVVLMDLGMPGKNGFDASQDITELDPKANILLITGLPDTDLARKALETGLVKAVIPKPYSIDQLHLAVQGVVKKPKPSAIPSTEREVVA
jgi:CheY-like chemotaxis protein